MDGIMYRLLINKQTNSKMSFQSLRVYWVTHNSHIAYIHIYIITKLHHVLDCERLAGCQNEAETNGIVPPETSVILKFVCSLFLLEKAIHFETSREFPADNESATSSLFFLFDSINDN